MIAGVCFLQMSCPRSLIGRVIGKGGDTIKATAAIHRSSDSSQSDVRIKISGSCDSVQLALNMINDIIRGVFKVSMPLRTRMQGLYNPCDKDACLTVANFS